MSSLLIVYHSRTGGAEAMARAAYEAARQECDTRILTAEDATVEDMMSASGYIFCAPENLAAISGEGVALVEKGAVEKAKRNLAKLESLCGSTCPETRDLQLSIASGLQPRMDVESASQGGSPTPN